MSPNLAIDESLLEQALATGGLRTKSETVNTALREFIQRRERLRLLNGLGEIDFDPRYDYKKERRSR